MKKFFEILRVETDVFSKTSVIFTVKTYPVFHGVLESKPFVILDGKIVCKVPMVSIVLDSCLYAVFFKYLILLPPPLSGLLS